MKFSILLLLIIVSCNNKIVSNKNIRDKNLAIKIAQTKFNKVYGKSMIAEEQPFRAKKINDSIWYVEGTFKSIGFGGVAFGKVDVKNKKVIEFSHGK